MSIGPDPDSKLWEFAHPLSGEIPVRNPVTGSFKVTGDTCIVLVLVPGGRATIGGLRSLLAPKVEGPVCQASVASFFRLKYETTQGQWIRLTGSNPSFFKPALDSRSSEDLLSRPVEQVSWDDCMLEAHQVGLRLPTEAERECACMGLEAQSVSELGTGMAGCALGFAVETFVTPTLFRRQSADCSAEVGLREGA
jgi:hypothetical protein